MLCVEEETAAKISDQSVGRMKLAKLVTEHPWIIHRRVR
jgi:hypothetical protein